MYIPTIYLVGVPDGGLVVGLLRLGLDGRLHPGLRHCGGDDADAPHGLAVVRPVRHRVRLLARERLAAVYTRDDAKASEKFAHGVIRSRKSLHNRSKH